MNFLFMALGFAAPAAAFLPLLAAPVIGFVGRPMHGAIANVGLCIVVFGLTCAVFKNPGGGLIHADELGMIFGVLTSFVAVSTALTNIAFVRSEILLMSVRRWRVYHAMCAVMLGTTILGLYADNIGMLWVAVEGATISATLGVSLPRTASALEAGWKYFVLGGVGIALADGVDQPVAGRVERRFRQPVWRHLSDHRDEGGRPPLKLGRFVVEPELGSGRHEPSMELAVNAR